jgi:hypothetical protein
MHMKTDEAPVSLAGFPLGEKRHICAFFHSRDEEYRTLLPFIKDGFARGDRAFHVVDPRLLTDHRRRLESAGIDVAGAEPSGQFELHDWYDAHLHEDRFAHHDMIAYLEAHLRDGAKHGFRVSRAIGHMEWALEGRPGTEDLVEYEARLNYMLPRYNDPIICVYDLTKFGGAVVADVLRTHPMAIIGGTLHENPFFVPPDEFLRDLRIRRTNQAM